MILVMNELRELLHEDATNLEQTFIETRSLQMRQDQVFVPEIFS